MASRLSRNDTDEAHDHTAVGEGSRSTVQRRAAVAKHKERKYLNADGGLWMQEPFYQLGKNLYLFHVMIYCEKLTISKKIDPMT